MQDPYPIPPFTAPVAASVTLPGSKSITNRALILAALAEGESLLTNCLFSEDTEIMCEALKQLGFELEADIEALTIRIKGEGGRIPSKKAMIQVGNSGTSARFLTALCSLGIDGEYQLDGVPQMRKRPNGSLFSALSDLGAEIDSNEGCFPITMRSNGIRGGKVVIDALGSSQFISALLMVAPFAREKMEISLSNTSVRRGYIDMTVEMLKQFKFPEANLRSAEEGYTVFPTCELSNQPYGYEVEGDASAASYFFALPLVVSGEIEIRGARKDSLQGDIAFAGEMERLGASIEWTPHSAICRYDRETSKPRAISQNFYPFSDTFLTAAAISPLLDGASEITGIAHTRHQECDRIAAMAEGLQRVGQQVKEDEGSLSVTPSLLQAATVGTFEDHRVAMSFGILGCYDLHGDGRPWLSVENPLCCKKTFPHFFDTLEEARQESLSRTM